MKVGWAWQKLAGASADQIVMWEKSFPDAVDNGILCRNTPAFDVDILNPEAAQEIEELTQERFGERGYFLTRFGSAPKRAIPFRTDEPFPKITENLIAPDGSEQKLEFLADGQQLVVFGVHPDTGAPTPGTVVSLAQSLGGICRTSHKQRRASSLTTLSLYWLNGTAISGKLSRPRRQRRTEPSEPTGLICSPMSSTTMSSHPLVRVSFGRACMRARRSTSSGRWSTRRRATPSERCDASAKSLE